MDDYLLCEISELRQQKKDMETAIKGKLLDGSSLIPSLTYLVTPPSSVFYIWIQRQIEKALQEREQEQETEE